jgi:hypothetical protein
MPGALRRAVAAGAALALASACGAPTRSDEAAAPGPVVVTVRDPQRMLQQHEAALRSLTLTAAARVAAALPVQGVALAILPDARRAIQGYGIGGYTSGPGSVELVVDPAFPGLAGVLPDRVPILVAHELHHTVRWRGPGYGRTLLEALISEGLADRFAVELLGVPPQPWSELVLRGRRDAAALGRLHAGLQAGGGVHRAQPRLVRRRARAHPRRRLPSGVTARAHEVVAAGAAPPSAGARGRLTPASSRPPSGPAG